MKQYVTALVVVLECECGKLHRFTRGITYTGQGELQLTITCPCGGQHVLRRQSQHKLWEPPKIEQLKPLNQEEV